VSRGTGDVSFMIALSEHTLDFDGGGTYFHLLRRTLHCPQVCSRKKKEKKKTLVHVDDEHVALSCEMIKCED
jgi:hypothetical protein